MGDLNGGEMWVNRGSEKFFFVHLNALRLPHPLAGYVSLQERHMPALGEHVTQGSRSSPSAAVQTERSVHAANVSGCSSSIPPYLHTACYKDAGLQEVKKICLLLFLLQNCPFCFSALWDFASPAPQGCSWLFLWPVCHLQMVAKTWNCMHWLCVSSPFGPSFPVFGAILQKLYFGVSAN